MKPILMKGELVSQTLAGTKTQTRRVVRPQPPVSVTDIISNCSDFVAAYPNRKAIQPFLYRTKSPYGYPGDILWVRETHAKYQVVHRVTKPGNGASYSEIGDGEIAYRADGYGTIEEFKEHVMLTSGFASGVEAVEVYRDRWLPSIHMPKWACRLFLRITDIRVERVQDISEDDAIAEGIDMESEFASLCINIEGCSAHSNDLTQGSAVMSVFQDLWDSINLKRGYGWDVNPWVWVVEYEVCKANKEQS